MSYYIIIRGPLGSGKTTVTKALAARLNAEYISVDEVLDDHNLADDKEGGFISQKSFKHANDFIVEMAKPILDAKRPIVIDGNFYWQSQIEDLNSKLVYPHAIFTLDVPLDACVKRDEERENPLGEDAVKAVYQKTASFEAGRKIDANQDIEEVVKEMIDVLLLRK
ncbi:MAG: AAA family ATPase [Patescibacteria group bacterium]